MTDPTSPTTPIAPAPPGAPIPVAPTTPSEPATTPASTPGSTPATEPTPGTEGTPSQPSEPGVPVTPADPAASVSGASTPVAPEVQAAGTPTASVPPEPTVSQPASEPAAAPAAAEAPAPTAAPAPPVAPPAAPAAPPAPPAPAPSGNIDVPQDDKAKLLPFYLVCDVSYSMVESGSLDEANHILPALVQALEKDPIISDKVRFGVIDFSDDARVLLPLCDLLEQTSLPALEGRGKTSYKAAFDLLRNQIESDVNQLKADGYQVHRPAVFFLSDGAPTDSEADWKASFDALTTYDKASGQGNRMYPNIIPFGLQGCDPQVLQQVIHPKAPAERAMRLFLADQDQTPASAVTKMAKMLVASVIQSGSTLASGGTGIVLPKTEDGVKSYAADDDVFL